MGTIGGNLCLDTRCNYYNQNYEWRKAIDFCLKKDGEICWVATASKRCVAMSSTDCAPALMALGAKVRLVSATGEREIALEDLYRNDGIDYLTRRPDEILTEVILPAEAPDGEDSGAGSGLDSQNSGQESTGGAGQSGASESERAPICQQSSGSRLS